LKRVKKMTDFVMPHGDLLVAPESQEWIESLLATMAEPNFMERFNRKGTSEPSVSAGDDFWTEVKGTWRESLRPYTVNDGVLTIPVKGMLLKGLPYALGGYATGYEYITAAVERGVGDRQVGEIVLDINSPGGTVAGCFDCSDVVFAARGAKPIRAMANESAYSAAYAIASAADDITVARTGGVGSIGVIAAHMEVSSRLEQQGIKVTPVYAGKQKIDGQPYVPLSDEAKARMQERTDALYDIFVSTVARNRGLDEQTVRDTEAATFMAPQAVENGLADAVGTLDSLSANADPSNNDDEDEEMSTVEQAVHDAAVAQATTDGNTAGKMTGATDERARVSTIMDSEEAKTRPAAARHVALNSNMSAEEASTFLTGLPEETPQVDPNANNGNSFADEMSNGNNPNLGADDGNGDGNGNQSEMSVADKIFASAGHAPT
jgi:signal peptide peptidase SppA